MHICTHANTHTIFEGKSNFKKLSVHLLAERKANLFVKFWQFVKIFTISNLYVYLSYFYSLQLPYAQFCHIFPLSNFANFGIITIKLLLHTKCIPYA